MNTPVNERGLIGTGSCRVPDRLPRHRGRLFAFMLGWLFCSGIGSAFAQNQEMPVDEQFSLGVEYLRTDRFGEAEGVFLSLLERGAAAPFLYHNLGIVYLRQGGYERAVEQFRKALEMDREFHPARVLLGASLVALGKNAEGLEELDLAVNSLPEDPTLRLELAQAYRQAGRPLEGLAQLRDLSRADPSNPELIYQVASAYVGLVEWCFGEMRRLGPASARVWQAAAQNQMALGDFAAAAASLEEAVKVAPKMTDLNLMLAQAYARQGKLLEAIRAVDAELALVPTNRGAQQLREVLVQRASGNQPQP